MKILLSNPPQVGLEDFDVNILQHTSKLLCASSNNFDADLKRMLKEIAVLDERQLAQLIVDANRYYCAAFDLVQALSSWQFTLLSQNCSNTLDPEKLPKCQ